MSKLNNSGFHGQESASKAHYNLGKKIIGSDLDMIEQTYKNNELTFIAVIDYKHGFVKSLFEKYAVSKTYMKLSKDYDIPYFIVITYLEPENFKIPMWYVKPVNDKAKEIFEKYKMPEDGRWFSMYDYSRFQHEIRNIKFNPLEHDDRTGITLKNLCKENCTYPLPTMDF